MSILERLHHPSFVLHLDVKAMSTDEAPTPELIRRHGAVAGHFHANDVNRRGPGFGSTDFRPIFQALAESQYKHWVSVEVFDYAPDPVTIARDSLQYMAPLPTMMLLKRRQDSSPKSPDSGRSRNSGVSYPG